jgi:hypothetical protein
MTLFKVVQKRSQSNLIENAFSALKRNKLNNRIVSQFALRRQLSIQLTAFMSLKENLFEKLALRENVLREASIISFE